MCRSESPVPRCYRVTLMVAVLVAGCRGQGPGTGTVSGRVLVDGAPLPGGRITFEPSSGGNPVMAVLGEDGSYPRVELPFGEIRVRVDNRELQRAAVPRSFNPPAPALQKALAKKGKGGGIPVDPPPPPSIPGRYVKIIPKYYQTESSGLTFTVEGGEQTHDIVLSSQ
jgi:hypothetical protein